MNRITIIGLSFVVLLAGACTDSKDKTPTTTTTANHIQTTVTTPAPVDSSDCSDVRGNGGYNLC